MRRRGALFVVGALGVWLTTARMAHAEQAAALDFERAEGLAASCPDESTFRKLVIARLGYDPFLQDARDRVRVTLVMKGNRVAASVALLRDGQPPRTPRAIEGAPSECESLEAALATTLSIALDPLHAGAPKPTEPPAPVEEPAAAAPSEPPPAKETEQKKEKEPDHPASSPHVALGFFASAAPVASLGVAPAPTLGGEAGLGAARGRFSLQLLGRAETMTAPTHLDSGDRVTAALYTGTVVPCGAVSGAQICGLVRLGIFDGKGVDLATKDPPGLFYAALGARVGYEVRLGESFALEPSLEAEVPLRRITLNIGGSDVWTAPVVSAAAALSLRAYF